MAENKRQTLGEQLLKNRYDLLHENIEYKHLKKFFEEVEKTFSFRITACKEIEPCVLVANVLKDRRFMYLLYDAVFNENSDFRDLKDAFEQRCLAENLDVVYLTSKRFIFFGKPCIAQLSVELNKSIDPGII